MVDDSRSDSKTPAPDPAKLVERLQSLKNRLANMAQTLENSVAASTPVKGSASDEIMYSTPKVVKDFLESQVTKDFVSSDYVANESEQIIEIRYTIAASSQEEVDRIISEIRQKPDIKPTTLTYWCYSMNSSEAVGMKSPPIVAKNSLEASFGLEQVVTRLALRRDDCEFSIIIWISILIWSYCSSLVNSSRWLYIAHDSWHRTGGWGPVSSIVHSPRSMAAAESCCGPIQRVSQPVSQPVIIHADQPTEHAPTTNSSFMKADPGFLTIDTALHDGGRPRRLLLTAAQPTSIPAVAAAPSSGGGAHQP